MYSGTINTLIPTYTLVHVTRFTVLFSLTPFINLTHLSLIISLTKLKLIRVFIGSSGQT